MSVRSDDSDGDPSSAADPVIELARCVRGWAYWLVAFTFAWGFSLMMGVKLLRWYQGPLLVYVYPVACLIASVLLLVSKGKARIAFAIVNFTSAVAWTIFYVWVIVEFSRHFWK